MKTPPRWADKFLEWYCNPDLIEDLQGDLHERFNRRVIHRGIFIAKLLFIIDVFSFLRPYTFRRRTRNHKYTAMIFSNFRFSVRSLTRNKLFTTLHVLGLTLGISVSLLILLFIRHELSFDQWNVKADRTYRINSTWKESDKEFNLYATPVPLASVIKSELPGIETIARIFPQFNTTVSISADIVFSQDHILIVEPAFLSIFDINVIHGDRRALHTPYQAFVSQSTARKFFGDEDPIGRVFRFRGKYDIKIAGVFQDLPGNTNLPASILISYVDDTDFLSNGDTWFFGGAEWTTLRPITLAVIKPLANISDIQSVLDRIAEKYVNTATDNDGIRGRFSLQPLLDIHLDATKFGGSTSVPATDSMWLFIFGGIGATILFLGCVNFVILTSGQSIARAKEAGIRKSIGGTRTQLIFQFLMEPILLMFFSASIAVVISTFATDLIKEYFSKDMSLLLLANPMSLLSAFFLLLLTAVVAGWYPTWLVVRRKPGSLLRPGIANGIPGSSWLQRSLIIFQFSASALLMIIVFVFEEQVAFMKSKDLGFTKDAVLVVSLPNTMKAQVFVNSIGTIPGIVETSLSRSTPMSVDQWWNTMGKIGTSETETVCVINADDKFVDVYDLKLLSGRLPTIADTISDVHRVLVNEELLRSLDLGTPEEAIGKQFSWSGIAEISGVIADFNSEPLRYGISPALIYQDPDVYAQANIRIENADDLETMTKIKTAWKKEFPSDPYDAKFLSDQINNYYRTESTTHNMFLIFSGIAILISSLGLFGICFLGNVRRAREISIRKVLGASVENVTLFLSRDFLTPVVIACIISVPIAWWSVKGMLDIYAYRLNLTWDLFALPVMLLICIASGTTLVLTVRAALVNPVENLKNE